MPNFADSLRASIEADARFHLGAQALPGTRRTIGRRRAAATVGYGAGSALAVGAVAVAAATLAGREEPTPASSLLPMSTPEVAVQPTTSYATVDLTDPVIANRQHATDALCGAPAPIPTSSSQGISAEFDIITDGLFTHQTSGEDLHDIGTVVLSGHVEDKLPAYVHQPQAVFVQDGVVVGMGTYDQSVSRHMLSNTWEGTYPLFLYGLPETCGQDEISTPLTAGEYDMYVVSRVTASEVEAAVEAAQSSGVRLPPADLLSVYRPGSYECESLYVGQPLSCDESALPGASIDFEAQTATIPYQTDLFTRELDVTLVSEPITVRVEVDVDPPATQSDVRGEPFTAESAPMCGAQYSHAHGTQLMAFTGQSLADLVPGNTLGLGMWLASPAWTEVTVDMPATARVWLMKEQLVPLEGDVGSASLSQVAGWMDIAVRDAGELTIDRYDGPQRWSARVTDMSWCADQQPESIRAGWFVATHSLTDDAGTRDRTGTVQIVSGE